MKTRVRHCLGKAFLILLFVLLGVHLGRAASELVSISTGGTQTSLASTNAAIDGTGRFVAFDTLDSNLASNDFAGFRDVYLRDRLNGETTRVSMGLHGVEPNGDSSQPAISQDGRYVAFVSTATNLVPGDTNAASDIFVYDRVMHKTVRASVRTGGGQALGGGSRFPAISGNGRFVAFVSDATNLVPNDSNAMEDVFVHDLKTKTTTRVSIRSDGNEVFGPSFISAIPRLSFDGRYVAFASGSGDLVDVDNNTANGAYDIFIRDRVLQTTTLVSRNSAGVQAAGFCNSPSLSADGRVVAFISTAGNLDGAGGSTQVYVRNLVTGVTARVRPAATYSFSPSLSADGSRVGLTTKVGAATEQVEVVDRTTGKVFQPARQPNGNDSGTSSFAAVSADGRDVAFGATSDLIAANDANGVADIIARPLFDSVGFTQTAYYVLESAGNATVTIRREGVLNGAVSVNYAISTGGDTAKPGLDYNPAAKTGTLNWAAGDMTNRTLTIPIVNTAIADGYRFFTVSLTSPTGGVNIDVPRTTVVLRDTESDPVENRIGHRLQIRKIQSRGTDWNSGLFRAAITLRNPAPLPSFPGFVELRFNGNVVGNATFTSVPAHGLLTIEASADVGQFPDGKLFAVLFETTDSGPIQQDSGLAAGYIDNHTAPPSGGTTQPNTGVKASGPPPVVVKTITVNGPPTVDEGSAADYTVTVTLSDNSTLANVTPGWSASAFAINGAGHFTAGDVAADKAVTLTARVTRNGFTTTKTRGIIVKNVPATPIITSSATAFATRGKPFSYRITARHEPTSFAAMGLPDGLTLNTSTGFITGTPTVANTFNATIQAINAIGTDTDPLMITVSEPSPLTVNIVGTGTVTPDLNGQMLDVGRTFKLLAKPGPDQLFNGWSGDITSEPPALTFVMTPNLTLTATFVANPYLTRNGLYVGLIQSTPATHEAGGLFVVTVAKTGQCTGKLILGGKPRPFKTLLKPNGTSPTITIPVLGGDPIVFNFSLDVAGMSGVITGNLTAGPLSATITARLAIKDTAALAGHYTVVLPGPATPSPAGDTPDGSGFGTVNITATGSIKLVGVLGDGTPISQSAPVTIGNFWPVYIPLYATQGSVFGLATFTPLADSDFNSQLSWFKPERPTDLFYPAGWPAGLVQDFRGARYTQPPVFPGLNAPSSTGNAFVQLSGGGLQGTLTQNFNLNDNGSLTRIEPPLQNFTLSIAASTGLFKGTFFDSAANKVRTFTGALQQKLHLGSGLFRGNLQRTGGALLQGTP